MPWCALLRSPALLTLLVAYAGFLWGYWVLVACAPSYINNLLDVGIEWNGLVSAAPHLAMMVCSSFFGWLGDLIHTRGLLSLSNNRKLLNTIGECGAGVLCLLIAALGPQNPPLAVALLAAAGGLVGACFPGCAISFVDISPNFSGVTFAVGNTLGSFVGAFAPYAEAFFVDLGDPMPGWSNVFYLTAAMYLVFNLVWCVWGTAEVQPWNEPGVAEAAHTADSPSSEGHQEPRDTADMTWPRAVSAERTRGARVMAHHLLPHKTLLRQSLCDLAQPKCGFVRRFTVYNSYFLPDAASSDTDYRLK